MKYIAILTVACFTATSSAPAFADPALSQALRAKLLENDIDEMVSLGASDLARKLAQTDCDYASEQTATLFHSLREGLEIDHAIEEERGSDHDFGLAAYIARLAEYQASGPTREVEARAILAVIDACSTETEAIIESAAKN